MYVLEKVSLHPEGGVVSPENHIEDAAALGIFGDLLHAALQGDVGVVETSLDAGHV